MELRIGPLTLTDRRLLFEDALTNCRTPAQQALVLLRASLNRRAQQRRKRRAAQERTTALTLDQVP